MDLYCVKAGCLCTLCSLAVFLYNIFHLNIHFSTFLSRYPCFR